MSLLQVVDPTGAQARVAKRDELQFYCYELQSTLNDPDVGIADKLSNDEKYDLSRCGVSGVLCAVLMHVVH